MHAERDEERVGIGQGLIMDYFAVTPGDSTGLKLILNEQLAEAADAQFWYALVDCAFDHGKQPLRLPDSTGFPIYHQGRLEALSPVSPTLFELATQDAKVLQQQLTRLLRHCSGRPMLSFIRSALPANVLREYWQSLLEVETADGDHYLLRFGDTRVLPTLGANPTIWSRLAAHAEAWCVIGREGHAITLAPPDTPEFDDRTLTIDNDCLAALLTACRADAMADYLNTHFPDLLAPRDGAVNYAILAQVFQLCDKHEIDRASEQQALAVAVLLTDAHLLEAAGFDQWLSEKAWQPEGMAEALADWMEEKELV